MPDGFVMTLDSAALEKKLKALGTEQANKVMAKAFREGAQVYQAKVSERAPERPELPSGTALPVGALKSDVVIRKAPSNDGPIYEVTFGSETIHVADWVETGHRLVLGGYSKEVIKNGEHTGKYRGPGKEVAQVEPHPFFREAFEEASPDAEHVISDAITQGIEKATR